LGGLLAGAFYPVVDLARIEENGLGPYSIGLIIAVAALLSTLIFSVFFMNLPVQGSAIEIGAYFRGKPRQHFLGMAGGVIWFAGLLALLVLQRAEGPAAIQHTTSYAASQGGLILAALFGLIAWHEFAGAERARRSHIAVALFVLAIGVVFVSNFALSGPR
jgi:glucose uptake protein